MSVKHGLAVALWGVLGVWSLQAGAACNDRTDPLLSPVSGVALKFNNGVDGRVKLLGEQVQDNGRLRLPALVPAAAALQAGTFGPLAGQVVYLEPDGKSGQRVCRLEQWESRVNGPLERPQPNGKPGLRRDDDGKVRAVAYRAEPRQERNPILAGLTPHYFMTRVDTFGYDSNGHLVEARFHETDGVNAASTRSRRPVIADQLVFCARYDAKGQLTMVAGVDEQLSAVKGLQCDQIKAGDVAMTTYQYHPDGTLLASLRTAGPKAAGTEGEATPALGQGNAWYANAGHADARTDVLFSFIPGTGVISLSTADMRLVPADAQQLFQERSSEAQVKLRYDFPARPVPLSAIDARFVSVGNYARVRTYPHRSGLDISELFDADKRTPRQRQWRGLDLNRQEMFDSSGRLTRVIHYGAAPRDAYKDDLRGYAERGVLRLTPTTSGYASYRVYDYDAKGRESLAFVCWQHDAPSNKPLRHFPWWTPDPGPKRSREEALAYGMKNVANRCGRPDGTMVIQGLAQIDAYMAKTYGYDVDKLSYEGR